MRLKTDKEAWLVANKRHSITCVLQGDLKEEYKVHWARRKYLISAINDVNIKERLINKTMVQLIFVNASVSEAGEYNCIADNGLGTRINSTIDVHVGGKCFGISLLYSLLDNQVDMLTKLITHTFVLL